MCREMREAAQECMHWPGLLNFSEKQESQIFLFFCFLICILKKSRLIEILERLYRVPIYLTHLPKLRMKAGRVLFILAESSRLQTLLETSQFSHHHALSVTGPIHHPPLHAVVKASVCETFLSQKARVLHDFSQVLPFCCNNLEIIHSVYSVLVVTVETFPCTVIFISISSCLLRKDLSSLMLITSSHLPHYCL